MSGAIGGSTSTPVTSTLPLSGLDGPARSQVQGSDDTPPVGGADDAAPSSSIPVLGLPEQTDATTLMNKLLALKAKMSDEQIKGSQADIKGDAAIRKNQADEAAKKMQEALAKQADAHKNDKLMKVLGWVAVALTVVAAVAISVASFGTATAVAALVCAAVIVTMATLNETGQMDKMQGAIQQSLQKDGMSEDDAKKWALGLNMAIQLSVAIICTVATLGAGASESVSSLIQVSATVAKGAKAVSMTADVANDAGTIAQQGLAIDSAVKTRDATRLQADSLDLKALLAKLQATQDDEQDRLQQMVQQASEVVSRAMKILAGQSDSQSNIVQHMG